MIERGTNVTVLFLLTLEAARLGFRGTGLGTGDCLPHCRGQGAEPAPVARSPLCR